MKRKKAVNARASGDSKVDFLQFARTVTKRGKKTMLGSLPGRNRFCRVEERVWVDVSAIPSGMKRPRGKGVLLCNVVVVTLSGAGFDMRVIALNDIGRLQTAHVPYPFPVRERVLKPVNRHGFRSHLTTEREAQETIAMLGKI